MAVLCQFSVRVTLYSLSPVCIYLYDQQSCWDRLSQAFLPSSRSALHLAATYEIVPFHRVANIFCIFQDGGEMSVLWLAAHNATVQWGDSVGAGLGPADVIQTVCYFDSQPPPPPSAKKVNLKPVVTPLQHSGGIIWQTGQLAVRLERSNVSTDNHRVKYLIFRARIRITLIANFLWMKWGKLLWFLIKQINCETFGGVT